MKYCTLLSAFALLALCACAQPMTPQQEAFLEELANRPVTCKAGPDCEEKWNRAIEWIDAHAQQKIRTISDDLIATNMVYTGRHDSAGRTPEFTVVRYAQGRRAYVMHFDSYCDHGFACNPSGLKLKASFVTFVMGLPPGVSQPRPGVFQKTVSK